MFWKVKCVKCSYKSGNFTDILKLYTLCQIIAKILQSLGMLRDCTISLASCTVYFKKRKGRHGSSCDIKH